MFVCLVNIGESAVGFRYKRDRMRFQFQAPPVAVWWSMGWGASLPWLGGAATRWQLQ